MDKIDSSSKGNLKSIELTPRIRRGINLSGQFSEGYQTQNLVANRVYVDERKNSASLQLE